MEENNKIISTWISIPIENIDTDQIYPGRFLKVITKIGLGKYLFADWNQEKKEMFNALEQSQIVAVGSNFGCGSSREHAVWALSDKGVKVLVSDSFADIFKNNALINGVLPIEVSKEFLEKLLSPSDPNSKLIVHIQDQYIQIEGEQHKENFAIDTFRKNCLLTGKDTVDFLIDAKKDIEAFENKRTIKYANIHG